MASASSRSPTACARRDAVLGADRRGRAHEPPRLDVLGDLAQRDLAQRVEVLDPEEAVERGRHPLGLVDLAGLQPLDQGRRRHVDEHDLVGSRQHGVGERLAHPHAGQLGDLVVERLQVLHVHGREHVDPRREHVGDVLVALGVLGARGVRVRELVDQRQLRRAQQQAGKVHLRERHVLVGEPPARELRQPGGDRLGLRPPVRLEVADHDVAPRLELRVAFLQHPVRLADAGGHAQEDLVMALHAPRRLWTSRSISLIPTNGAIRPPTPYRSRLRRSSAVAPTGR